MIIEVRLTGEDAPRRYRVAREDGVVCMRRLASPGAAAGSDDQSEPLCVDWRTPEPRVYSMLINGNSYDVHIDADEDDEESLSIHLLSHVVRAQAADARKRRVVKSVEGPHGTVRIAAPIPGRVVTVLATEGTEVNRGDGIIVLEAMKMENELRTPRAGTVTSIAVEEGQGVEAGAVLATIE